jgi:single stranded DNA-binding protein
VIEHFLKVLALGRATADPVRKGRDRSPVVTVGFVYNDREKRGDNWIDRPCFIDCEATRELGDRLAKLVRKGYLIYIEGKLRRDEWTDRDQVRHVKYIIVLSDFKLMQKPKRDNPPVPLARSEPVAELEDEPAQSSEAESPGETMFGHTTEPEPI